MERCACCLLLPRCLFTQSCFHLHETHCSCSLWAGLTAHTLTCSRPPRVKYSTHPPPWLQREVSQQAHPLENACGLINSISGGKTRLHPSHVVQENSLETCRQIAYKPPLGRSMLLKTCDHKYVVVPDIAEHWAGFLQCTLGSTGNAPWPQIPWWMWNPKSSPSGVSNLPPGCKYNFNCSLSVQGMNLQSWNSKWSKTLNHIQVPKSLTFIAQWALKIF